MCSRTSKWLKLKRRTMLRYDLAIDVVVTILVLTIHWGTFSEGVQNFV